MLCGGHILVYLTMDFNREIFCVYEYEDRSKAKLLCNIQEGLRVKEPTQAEDGGNSLAASYPAGLG